MAYHVEPARFQKMAELIYEELPDEFREKVGNVTILIEDLPSADDLRITGASRANLLGLFRGVGYPHRDSFFSVQPLPDEIILFQKNIERHCRTEKELREEIRHTLLHEIGHYFGMSEEDLEEFG